MRQSGAVGDGETSAERGDRLRADAEKGEAVKGDGVGDPGGSAASERVEANMKFLSSGT